MKSHITVVITFDDQASITIPEFDAPLLGGRVTGLAAYSCLQTEEIAINALEQLEHEEPAGDALMRINAITCGLERAQ